MRSVLGGLPIDSCDHFASACEQSGNTLLQRPSLARRAIAELTAFVIVPDSLPLIAYSSSSPYSPPESAMDSPLGVLLILGAGLVIVVAGILALRLHAFIALILAALLVAALTPQTALERFHVESVSSAVERVPGFAEVAEVKGSFRSGTLLLLLRKNPVNQQYEDVSELTVDDSVKTRDNWITARVSDPDALNDSEENLLAIDPLQWNSARKNAKKNIGERIAAGFGSTCASIGILVAMASIIGNCLLHSGAADRIVRTTLNCFGEKSAPLAFMFSGFLLAIPVFFDTVFYLMIPLGKAMHVRTGKNYLLYVLTIICGGTMAHSLVPPTPGPLIAAQQLNVNLGTMIIGGTIVGLIASSVGLLFAFIINRRCELPLRDSADLSVEDLQKALNVPEHKLPSFWLSLIPILLPVVLISLDAFQDQLRLGQTSRLFVSTFGDKNISIILGAIAALALLVYQKRPSRNAIASAIQKDLAGAGVIILITAAGGAFGGVMRETGVASLIRNLPDSSPAMLCTLAFLVTVAIRTAQGSASVAMITAAGIFSGLAHEGTLGFHPVYLALAIGCGSKPFAWMADSGFWVMTRMSGMTETEGLKFITPMTFFMGVAGLLATLVGVTFLPNF